MRLSDLKGSTLLINDEMKLCSALVVQCNVELYGQNLWYIAEKELEGEEDDYTIGERVILIG